MPVNEIALACFGIGWAKVVSNYSAVHSHWASMRSLGGWLSDHNVPGICGVDTRAITKVREASSSRPSCVQTN
jgi:carbamoylphosphate synthase small subunit